MTGRATPQGRTAILPDSWSAHHQPVAEGTQKGLLTIWSGPAAWVNVPGGQETMSLGTKLSDAVPFSLAQPERQDTGGESENGADATWVKEVLISMPASVQGLVEVGALLEVAAWGPAGPPSADTPVGAVYVVLGPTDGTERFETAVRARRATKGNLPQ